MHNPTDMITHTMAFVTPVMEHWLEREMAQWVHPMKDRTMSKHSYHGATSRYIYLLCFLLGFLLLLLLSYFLYIMLDFFFYISETLFILQI